MFLVFPTAPAVCLYQIPRTFHLSLNCFASNQLTLTGNGTKQCKQGKWFCSVVYLINQECDDRDGARASLRGISLSVFVGVDNDNFIFRAYLPRRRLKTPALHSRRGRVRT